MRGLILYKQRPGFFRPQAYGINRLLEYAQENEIELKYVVPESLRIVDGRVLIDGKEISKPNFIIPRTGPYTDSSDLETIQSLEKLGVRSINTSSCIKVVNDKFASYQVLSQNSIPVPKTILAKLPVNKEVIEKEIDYPMVIKPLSGAQGKGVILGESFDVFKSIKDKEFLIQEFIKSSRGRDLRVFTIGLKAIACVERIGPQGDFRANFSLGGTVRPYPMSTVIEELAIKTVRALGLEIGGIDLLFEGDKFRVCEANFSPGFESIEKCFNLDIPEKIFNYIKDR